MHCAKTSHLCFCPHFCLLLTYKVQSDNNAVVKKPLVKTILFLLCTLGFFIFLQSIITTHCRPFHLFTNILELIAPHWCDPNVLPHQGESLPLHQMGSCSEHAPV